MDTPDEPPPLRWETLDDAAERSGRTTAELKRDNGMAPDHVRPKVRRTLRHIGGGAFVVMMSGHAVGPATLIFT